MTTVLPSCESAFANCDELEQMSSAESFEDTSWLRHTARADIYGLLSRHSRGQQAKGFRDHAMMARKTVDKINRAYKSKTLDGSALRWMREANSLAHRT